MSNPRGPRGGRHLGPAEALLVDKLREVRPEWPCASHRATCVCLGPSLKCHRSTGSQSSENLAGFHGTSSPTQSYPLSLSLSHKHIHTTHARTSTTVPCYHSALRVTRALGRPARQYGHHNGHHHGRCAAGQCLTVRGVTPLGRPGMAAWARHGGTAVSSDRRLVIKVPSFLKRTPTIGRHKLPL